MPTIQSQHAELDRERTWSDETTHAIYESQTLRIECVHEAHPRETAWTVAAYETPVSDRMWHLTATGATPAPVLQTLLHHLAEGDGWDTAVGGQVEEKTVAAATRPHTDAGWEHTVDGRWIRWTNLTGDAGVQFDAFAAQKREQQPDDLACGPTSTSTVPPGLSMHPPTTPPRSWPASLRASPTPPAPAPRQQHPGALHSPSPRHPTFRRSPTNRQLAGACDGPRTRPARPPRRARPTRPVGHPPGTAAPSTLASAWLRRRRTGFPYWRCNPRINAGGIVLYLNHRG
ncbi:DUF317 domain-containing protein [Streptomyces virginiae]|uniref:DUF317 domain-containing protein n=1 Tax=Streptomyces virginiae TaxID=1961 RepID=UPI0033A41427